MPSRWKSNCSILGLIFLGLAVAAWLVREGGLSTGNPEETRRASSIDTSAGAVERLIAPDTSSPSSPPEHRASPQISASDPTAAVRSAPSGDADEARAWTRSHLEEALLWLVDAPPGPLRDAVLEIACLEVAQYKPSEAAALADRYSGGRTDLLENITHQWAAQDLAAAEAYALGKPLGEMRNRLLGRVAVERAQNHPEEAAKFAIEQMTPGGIRTEAIIAVLQKWIKTDQDAAMKWALSFPEEALRERVVRELAGALAFADE